MSLRPAYPIDTARLLLRPLTQADVEAVAAYRSRPDVCRYVPFEPMSADVVRERLAQTWVRHDLDDEGQAMFLGVEHRDSHTVVGDVILFWHSREHQSGEIGYVFSPDYGGQGYATEAAHALLHLAFDDLGLHRVTARLDARNDASARVVRRLGMREEAHLVENEWFKGEWTDELDFGLLASEWAQREPTRNCPRCA